MYGPSGTRMLYDGFCVLPFNMLNDKLFLVLWFWYFFLLTISSANVLYWLFHIISPRYRLSHIERHLKGTVKGNQLKFLNQHFGDWFVLHLLYKNIHHSNFTRLVSKLCSIEEGEKMLKKQETYISFDDQQQRSEKSKVTFD